MVDRVRGATGDPAPLIVTATLPPELFSWAQGLRRAYFPPERNHIDAHVTLFHAIPPSCERELRHLLADVCAQTGPVPARLESVMSLGRGTAFKIISPDLLDLRAIVADRFAGSLTSQDSHRPNLHITVQNKVSGDDARQLQARLRSDFSPRTFEFIGLETHYYRGGPWENAAHWRFRKKR
ncbi:2'-5' RNA ligase family protein [Croceicoccus sp. YJ47]|uniref:2'-5' RNA ligase family protein n=1 Tax=Croceicoccus sp. YJ47 TaxID=2798724 RepID=UPI001923E6A9|nr:2'-5' RNA ligase family protein [Croceicoccus sp. YJ47]QQN73904.1 2'-5' RNA ligase family protein [Croceicoccus sp. YJ47]